MEVRGKWHPASPLPLGQRHVTHRSGGWVGPRTVLDSPVRTESLYGLRYPSVSNMD